MPDFDDRILTLGRQKSWAQRVLLTETVENSRLTHGIEVAVQSVCSCSRSPVWQKAQFKVMDESKSVIFRATAKMKRRNGFADGVEGETELGSVSSHPNASIKLIHLHEGENEVTKEIVVPALTVTAHAFESTGEGRIRVTGEAHENGNIDPFRQKPEEEFDLVMPKNFV